MTTISIVTSGHFSTSPRVIKEADALAAAGFDVEVFGVRYDPFQAELDDSLAPRTWRFTPVADLTAKASQSWPRFWFRTRRKLGELVGRWLVPDPHALGFAMKRMVERTLKRAAKLTILHLEPALWVGCQLAKRGLAVGVDIEDWHSESPSWVGEAKLRRMVARYERAALANARHRTTTSHALAEALAASFGIAAPEVVYNSTSSGGRLSPAPEGDLRLFWFSQTVGFGRGLELLFDALATIDRGWTLTLLGRCAPEVQESLLSRLPDASRGQVAFAGFVKPGELHAEASRHDVGLALETADCLNHDLTASNKIFQCLQAGLYVLATATAGQSEVLRRLPENGRTFAVGDCAALAALVREAIAVRENLRKTRAQRAVAADAQFAYEHSAKVLVESVRRAIA